MKIIPSKKYIDVFNYTYFYVKKSSDSTMNKIINLVNHQNPSSDFFSSTISSCRGLKLKYGLNGFSGQFITTINMPKQQNGIFKEFDIDDFEFLDILKNNIGKY